MDSNAIRRDPVSLARTLATKSPILRNAQHMKNQKTIDITLPSERYSRSFISAYEEFPASEKSDWIYLGPDGSEDLIYNRFPDYVSTLRRCETEPPSHFVRGRTYWAVQDGEVVGRIGLRFELNEFLARIGGHIGYIVRPSARGKGVASAMLGFVLTTPEAESIGKLLVTCNEDNLASERIILKHGGVYESTIFPEGSPVGKKRYWITAK